MTYRYNPHRHIKIWLSADKELFLNKENQLRLIYMRHINPNDEIYFIYDSSLLSDDALNQLDTFCQQHQLIAKDVQTDIIPKCSTQEEINLIEIYKDNITHLDEGGNLGAASDVLRWLQPAYELGTYTDLDVKVDTRNLPLIIEVEEPLLVNIGSMVVTSNHESLCICNDILTVVDSTHALPLIKKIQQIIYKASSTNALQDSSLFSDLLNNYKSNWEKMVSDFLEETKVTDSREVARTTDEIFAMDTLFQSIRLLDILSHGKTARELRHHILHLTENNRSYRKWIGEADSRIRQIIAIKTGLKKIQYNDYICYKSRTETRLDFLKNTVMYSTGPVSLLFGISDGLYVTPEQINKIVSYSMSYYSLDNAFISMNNLPFHTSAEDTEMQFAQTLGVETNDLSWLEEGRDAIRLREQKMDKAATSFQRFFRGSQVRNKREDIEHTQTTSSEIKIQ